MSDSPSKSKHLAEQISSGLSDFAVHAFDSFKYNLVQSPVTGVTQLVDHVAGSHLEEKTKVIDTPQTSNFATSGWVGDIIGGTAATVIQFGVLHRLVGAGAAVKFEQEAAYGLKTAKSLPYLAKSIGTGLAIGGLITPVADDSQHFWKDRFINAGVNGATFGTMTAGSVFLKSTGKAVLANDIVANGLSGIAAGEIDVDARSKLTTGHFADASQHIQTIAGYVLGGAFAGELNNRSEARHSTSGVPGVRTLQEMIDKADTTINPNAPKRWAMAPTMEEFLPKKSENMTEADFEGPEGRLNYGIHQLRLGFDENGTIPLWLRQRSMGGIQDLLAGLVKISERPNPKPIITMFGSARLGENTFDFHRARYMAGRAVQEGYDVMCGGADYGMMLAFNRGAYEAGGNSIGIAIRLKPFPKPVPEPRGLAAKIKSLLPGSTAAPKVVAAAPHEMTTTAGNGYQTVVLGCRELFTRQELLNFVQTFGKDNRLMDPGAVVIEKGGLGTLYEGTGVMTHMQIGLLPNAPTYIHDNPTWRLVEKVVKSMNKDGTAGAEDLDRLNWYKDPDKIFEDLRRRKAALELSVAT